MSSSGGGTAEEGAKTANTANEAPEVVSSTPPPPDEAQETSAGESPSVEPNEAPEQYPESPTPPLQPTGYPQLYGAPHLTPQPSGAYYMYPNTQVTPEPPSPAAAYDPSSFRNVFASGQYGGIPPAPLSPRSGMGSMGSIPPPSPLFPRVASGAGPPLDPQQLESAGLQRMNSGGGPPSPAPYLSPGLGPSASPYMYQPYGGIYNNGNGGSANSGSGEDNTWTERGGGPQYPQSPQPYSLARQGSGRTYSFDETSMLPPSVLEPQDHSNPAYSPYRGTQTGAAAGVSGTLFAQQTWGYGSSGDMYNAPPSPVPPRPTHAFGGRPAYGASAGGIPSYYPATSPGPPIQTTASNKGPDGANLFIFHIPNHFTNLDMYHLFCPYGNLLSVRIMVERDTGRSRGFGFVSYDSPDSAAMAIKELNGFAIGNKRLKVQHKQIRAGENKEQHGQQQQQHTPQQHYNPAYGGESLPHPGSWYDEPKTTTPQGSPREGEGAEEGGLYADGKSEGEGVDLHRPAAGRLSSPLGNLEPLRSALPDVTGQGAQSTG